jgi:hypothetical protein
VSTARITRDAPSVGRAQSQQTRLRSTCVCDTTGYAQQPRLPQGRSSSCRLPRPGTPRRLCCVCACALYALAYVQITGSIAPVDGVTPGAFPLPSSSHMFKCPWRRERVGRTCMRVLCTLLPANVAEVVLSLGGSVVPPDNEHEQVKIQTMVGV